MGLVDSQPVSVGPPRPPKPRVEVDERVLQKLTVMSYQSKGEQKLPVIRVGCLCNESTVYVYALVDTGAEMSSVSSAVCNELSLKGLSTHSLSNLHLEGVGGKLVKIQSALSVSVHAVYEGDWIPPGGEESCSKHQECEFAVVNSGFDMILSTPDMQRMGIHHHLPYAIDCLSDKGKMSARSQVVMSCSAIAKTWRATELASGGGVSSQGHEEGRVIPDESDLPMCENHDEGGTPSSDSGSCKDGEQSVVASGVPDSNPATRKSKRKRISEYALKHRLAHQRNPSSKDEMLRRRRRVDDLDSTLENTSRVDDIVGRSGARMGDLLSCHDLLGSPPDEDSVFADLDAFVKASTGVIPGVEGDFSVEMKEFLGKLFDEYKSVFNEQLVEAGAKVPPLELKPIPGAPSPRVHGTRRLAPDPAAFMAAEVKRLLAAGIIQPSMSKHRSAVVMDYKKGKWRMCVDYSDVNKTLVGLQHPLPNIRDILDQLAGKKFLGKMDLRSGYHQFPMAPGESMELTAFAADGVLYEYTRIPFGLKMAPAYFQKCMQDILGGLVGTKCFVYVDDIIVFGETETEFGENLSAVLAALKASNVVLRGEKCLMSTNAMEVLGYQLSHEGVTLTKDRKQGLLDIAPPTSIHTLRSFNGLANYFRPFIPNFSILSKPLTAATSMRGFEWTEELQLAFTAVKDAVVSLAMLHFIDDKLPLYLRTDASTQGVGGILFQRVILDDGLVEERPIAFVSKAFNATEQKWSTIEQEGFAIFHCIQKLNHYLMGRKFEVETDHRNLVFMANSATPKVVRWRLRLAEYDFDVRHIPGVDNVVADGLSRCLVTHCMLSMSGGVSRAMGSVAPADGVSANQQLIATCHNPVMGHFGVKRTVSSLRREGHSWAGMNDDVKSFIAACPVCQKGSPGRKLDMEVVATTIMSDGPFQKVSLDTMGPFPPDEAGNCYIIVAIDCFSRVVELKATKDASAEAAASLMLEVFGRYGPPLMIHSDNGQQYVANVIKEFLALLSIGQSTTLPYRPQANGICERANGEVLRHLRAITMENPEFRSTWSKYLPLVARIMNYSFHSAIGTYPARVLFGSNCRGLSLPGRVLFNNASPPVSDRQTYVKDLCKAQKLIIDASRKFQDSVIKLRASKCKPASKVVTLNNGDFVLATYSARAPSKLSPRWRGPYVVLDKAGSNAYRVQHLNDSSKEEVLHVSRLALFNNDNGDPARAALMDKGEDVIEEILEHSPPGPFLKGKRKEVDFKVRWAGHSEEEDMWIPYMEVRDCEALEDYLVRNDLKFK